MFAYQVTLIVEVWDDDPEENGDDLIDQFIITILDTVFAVNESEPIIIEGGKGTGYLTIVYCNLTTDQLVPSCSSTDVPTTAITSSSSKNILLYMHDL